ncbi:MAG: hypothetical protein QG599_265 [Pseudomonadota bacterium]|nr:hypothetical protein [Pseudomonadota bacterium]
MKKQQGFSLVEMTIVLTIIGILAAVALPRLKEANDAANLSALQSQAGALTALAGINYSLRLSLGSTAVKTAVDDTLGWIAIADCDDVSSLVLKWNPSYVITSLALNTLGISKNCTLTDNTTTKTAIFTAIGTKK